MRSPNERRDQASSRKEPRLRLISVLVGVLAVGLVGYVLGSLRPPATSLVVPDTPSYVLIQKFPDYRSLSAKRPSAEIDVTDRRQLSELIRSLNQLPPFPTGGSFNCGSGSGYYQLRFAYPDLDQWTVQLELGGCGVVNVAGEKTAIARVVTGSQVLVEIGNLFKSLRPYSEVPSPGS